MHFRHFSSRVRVVPVAGSIVTLRFSCLSVCLFVGLSQSGEAWERVSGVAAGMDGWFELAGLFASSQRKEAKR